MNFIGIDPGLKGAIAIINSNDEVVHVRDLPQTIKEYLDMVKETTKLYGIVAVENVIGRPGQSVIANTTFMKYAGYAEMLGMSFTNCEDNFYKVYPQTWKKYYGLTGNKTLTVTQRKAMSIDLAKKFYPKMSDVFLKSKDGRAEAVLIARYIKEQYEQK